MSFILGSSYCYVCFFPSFMPETSLMGFSNFLSQSTLQHWISLKENHCAQPYGPEEIQLRPDWYVLWMSSSNTLFRTCLCWGNFVSLTLPLCTLAHAQYCMHGWKCASVSGSERTCSGSSWCVMSLGNHFWFRLLSHQGPHRVTGCLNTPLPSPVSSLHATVTATSRRLQCLCEWFKSLSYNP